MANDKVNKESNSQTLHALASLNNLQYSYWKTQYPNGVNFLNSSVPKDYLQQVKKAKELREYDIVDRLLRIRQDYTLPIKGFKCRSKRQSKFYNEFVLPFIQDIASQWVYEHNTIGDVYGHYAFKKDEKTPMFFIIEDAENVIPVSALGYEIYKVRLSAELKEQLKCLKEQGMIDILPDYLQNAITPTNNGKYIIADEIILDKKHMNRSTNQKQSYQLRSKPPLIRIMKSILLREFFIDLDYLNGLASQKNSIIHVQVGTQQHPVTDKKVLGEVHEIVANRPLGQSIITTRGDVKISAVDIDMKNIFDSKKFEECNRRIFNFFGISIAFVPSTMGDASNSSVNVSLRPFEASIRSDRKVFEKFIRPFLEEVNRRNGFLEIPELEYEETNIVGDDLLIKRLQFLFNTGVISYPDLCNIYGYNAEEQLAKKKWDQENKNTIRPWFEPSQGLLQEDSKESSDLNMQHNSQIEEEQETE